MKCPQCSNNDTKVIESRDVAEAPAVRRRRECLACSTRFTTYERIERPNLIIVKRSGERQLYDRTKLLAGIMRACEKRPVSQVGVDDLITQIERQLYERDEPEISSEEVGGLVLDGLAELDPVAYVRFASVYKDFTSLKSFEQELERVKENTRRKRQEPS